MPDYTKLTGALLHDIGKIAVKTNKYQHPDRKQCKYGHEKRGLNIIEEDLKNTCFNNEIIKDIISKHHSDITDEHIIITKLADWLSSSEREENEDDQNEKTYKEQRLYSIFQDILNNKESLVILVRITHLLHLITQAFKRSGML